MKKMKRFASSENIEILWMSKDMMSEGHFKRYFKIFVTYIRYLLNF